MKYAGLNKNDIANGGGVCVSLWTQGCPHKCTGCHNPETWDETKGIEIDRKELISKIEEAISANGIKRNFSILGGEPLAPYNRKDVAIVINKIRKKFPNIIIYLWTGYQLEDLKTENDRYINLILNDINILIDGPYVAQERDISLELRGSRNQRILYKKIDF